MITIQHKKHGDITFEDGTSRAAIGQYLVQLDAASGKQYNPFGSFLHESGRAASSSIRQIDKWLGGYDEEDIYEDNLAEHKSRIMLEQNPISTVSGMLVGSVLDPVTLPAVALKPLTFASKVGTLAAKGSAQGLLGGVLEPVYEQYGDSTVLNIMAGMTLGAGIGAGVGKLLSKSPIKSTSTEAANEVLQDTSERALTNLASEVNDTPIRTREQVIDKVKAEMELEAAGAPSKIEMDDVKLQLDATQARLKALEGQGQRLQLGAKGRNKQQIKSASNKNKAQTDQARKELQELQATYDQSKLQRLAVENLEKIKSGKYSGIEGIEARFKAATPIRRSPLAQAVNETIPQRAKISPFSAGTSRILGIEDAADAKFNTKTGKFEDPSTAPINIKNTDEITYDDQGFAYRNGVPLDTKPTAGNAPVAGTSAPLRSPDSAGSRRVEGELNQRVGEELLPRTVDKPDVTARLVADKFTGSNTQTRINIKDSRANVEAKETVQRKLARGEEPTKAELERADAATFSGKALEDYKLFVQKIAGSRSLDTSAMKGILKGRYTFSAITEAATKLLQREGINDYEDMVDYILKDTKRIFSAEEMEMLTPLFAEAERKLYNAMEMVKHTEGMSDDMIAALHSEINLYYGIQAFNKSQGSKVSAALNHRNKMLKDIAEDRQIDSLWAGVKCK